MADQQPDNDDVTIPEGFGMKAAREVTVGDAGEVLVHFATIDEIDYDGEVIPPGAIPNGMKATVSSYSHDTVMGHLLRTGVPDQPPVGKGVIEVVGNKAIARVQYFMETQRGREAFLTVKAMGQDQAWSFAFRKEQVTEPDKEWRAKGARLILSKIGPLLDGAMELSPVKMPASRSSATLSAKSAEPPPAEDPPAPKVGPDIALETRLARLRKAISR